MNNVGWCNAHILQPEIVNHGSFVLLRWGVTKWFHIRIKIFRKYIGFSCNGAKNWSLCVLLSTHTVKCDCGNTHFSAFLLHWLAWRTSESKVEVGQVETDSRSFVTDWEGLGLPILSWNFYQTRYRFTHPTDIFFRWVIKFLPV